jgi:hypothetical protein
MFEVATCKHCGGGVGREYYNGKTQWWCQACNKGVKPLWITPPAVKTPMQTEPYEPLDGVEVEINIDDFQERLNHIG